MRPPRLLVLVFLALGAGCAAPADEDVSQNEDALTTYSDLFSTLEGEDFERWFAVRSALKDGFDRICGDTFCGGS